VRDASPLVTYGLYRLLLAVVQDVFAPQGKAEWQALFRRGRFDPGPLRKFAKGYADRFDLFHPTRPFYQSGNIPTGTRDGGGPSKEFPTIALLRPEVPTGSAKNHFHHAYDGAHAYCPGCAAHSLVVLPPFAYIQGSGYRNSINGSPPVYVWSEGRSLFETLCWNVNVGGKVQRGAAADGRPKWATPLV
jgi:CRISPR system Cascade subunit CasA